MYPVDRAAYTSPPQTAPALGIATTGCSPRFSPATSPATPSNPVERAAVEAGQACGDSSPHALRAPAGQRSDGNPPAGGSVGRHRLRARGSQQGTNPTDTAASLPVREAAANNREVVCGVHLGLMQGLLSELNAPITAHQLDAFVEPSLCITRLAARDNDGVRIHRRAS